MTDYQLTSSPTDSNTDLIVAGYFEDQPMPEAFNALKQSTPGLDQLILKNKKPGNTVWHTQPSGQSILMVHCGPAEKFTLEALKKRVHAVGKHLTEHHIESATLSFPKAVNATADDQLEHMVLALDYALHQLNTFKQKAQDPILKNISIHMPDASQQALTQALHVAKGITLCRILAQLPANICTPTYLAEEAKKIAKEHSSVKCTIWGEKHIRKMGMGALMAVAQGSDEPPQFIELHHQGDAKAKPIVLIGKGITFDSGGLSIKPANAMDEMKYDMAGAASVLGTLKACALLQLPLNVIGLIPTAENMVSGKSVKPGDIVNSMSGQTIEILNTDAEGRLILADALTYAERFDPQVVLDIATLTGAMVVALGNVTTGFMTKDEHVAQDLMKASDISLDKAWRLPLDDEYQSAMDSTLADMINANFDRTAGGITAACFLSRFAKAYPWAHLDIAGTAWVSGKNNHPTGRPVALLTQFLRLKTHAH